MIPRARIHSLVAPEQADLKLGDFVGIKDDDGQLILGHAACEPKRWIDGTWCIMIAPGMNFYRLDRVFKMTRNDQPEAEAA